MSPGLPRVLIVEDDPSWQQILAEILRDCGLEADLAVSFEEALPLMRVTPHRLAILDLSLGGSDHLNQDGLKVLEALQRHDPACTSIFLTGFATVELAVNVIRERGAFTCLRKETFRRAEFRKVIDQALATTPSPPFRSAELPPKDAPAELERAPAGTALPSGALDGDLALIVEDDAGWRSLLGELLRDAGFAVHQSVSYVEALGFLRSQSYQLAVIDLSLASSLGGASNQDGYRLLASTQKYGIPTIIVSGYAEPADIERAYTEYQLFACLEKKAFDREKFLDLAHKTHALAEAGPLLRNLTGREREVLALLSRGYTNKEIAGSLCITQNTVKRHLKSLFAKLGVNTRAAASAFGTRAGLLK